MTPDQRRWAEMRGLLTVAADGGMSWRLPVACRNLTADGRCGIYETRPDVCREFEAGGKLCKAAKEHQKEITNGKA
jgi:Fe-S-cluster containining protein